MEKPVVALQVVRQLLIVVEPPKSGHREDEQVGAPGSQNFEMIDRTRTVGRVIASPVPVSSCGKCSALEPLS